METFSKGAGDPVEGSIAVRRRSRGSTLSWTVAWILLFTLPPSFVGANVFRNGQFNEGGLGWPSEGPVEFNNGFAHLSDELDTILVRLQQTVFFNGPGRISFEFNPNLSTSVPLGTSPDTLFVSLYFIDDPALLDIDAGQFDDAIALFLADRDGEFLCTGELSPGTLGPGWMTYSVDILSTNLYIVPVIELIGANQVDADSSALVDNFRVRVDPSLLDPVLTSIAVDNADATVLLGFTDPKGWPEAFEIQSGTNLAEETSWQPEPGAAISCPDPGTLEVILPSSTTNLFGYFRIRVLGL
jgi:hypothetical protein